MSNPNRRNFFKKFAALPAVASATSLLAMKKKKVWEINVYRASDIPKYFPLWGDHDNYGCPFVLVSGPIDQNQAITPFDSREKAIAWGIRNAKANDMKYKVNDFTTSNPPVVKG